MKFPENFLISGCEESNGNFVNKNILEPSLALSPLDVLHDQKFFYSNWPISLPKCDGLDFIFNELIFWIKLLGANIYSHLHLFTKLIRICKAEIKKVMLFI